MCRKFADNLACLYGFCQWAKRIDNVTTDDKIAFMSTQTTIQVRIDLKTKEEARKTLREIGLDISSAIKLFLRNVAITQSVPLELRTVNGFTLAEESKIAEDALVAEHSAKRYTDIDAMLQEI